MTTIAGWPSVSLPGRQGVINIEGTQRQSLWSSNSQGGNDIALAAITSYCADHLGVPRIDDLMRDDALDELLVQRDG